tara:strand:+ start:1456 stop:1656 length:201 start_codon:yes stop_codon:yes gene_type:complete
MEEFQSDFDDEYWSIELNIKGIRLIHQGLSQAVEKWSGGNPDEQQDLIAMRDNFYKLILEYQFGNM